MFMVIAACARDDGNIGLGKRELPGVKRQLHAHPKAAIEDALQQFRYTVGHGGVQKFLRAEHHDFTANKFRTLSGEESEFVHAVELGFAPAAHPGFDECLRHVISTEKTA